MDIGTKEVPSGLAVGVESSSVVSGETSRCWIQLEVSWSKALSGADSSRPSREEMTASRFRALPRRRRDRLWGGGCQLDLV
jgi:hypothetical protein